MKQPEGNFYDMEMPTAPDGSVAKVAEPILRSIWIQLQ